VLSLDSNGTGREFRFPFSTEILDFGKVSISRPAARIQRPLLTRIRSAKRHANNQKIAKGEWCETGRGAISAISHFDLIPWIAKMSIIPAA
jgi:hypothetical protein